MKIRKIVVGTDILLDHLRGSRRPSVLRVAMRNCFCYTTVFSAIELFALARNAKERSAIRDSMAAMKLLGMNPKNAPLHAALFRSGRGRRTLDLLVAGLCLETGLPLLTGRTGAFKGIRGLTLLAPDEFRERRAATRTLHQRMKQRGL